MGYLVFSRKEGEDFFIGDDIEVIVSRIEGGAARIVISAPREVRILRGELYQRMAERPSASGEGQAGAAEK